MHRLGVIGVLCVAAFGSFVRPGLGQDRAPGQYVVVVDYAAPHDHFDQLKALVDGIALASIREPGCRRFDVSAPSGAPDHLTLYEVFDDEAAFKAHAQTAHFKQFAAATGAIGASRTAASGAMITSLHNP